MDDLECDLDLLFRTNRVVTASTHGDIDLLPLLTGNTVEWVLAFKGLKRSQVWWRDPCCLSTLVIAVEL